MDASAGARLLLIDVTRATVAPSPPHAPHVVALSNNDQVMPPLYTAFVYFFAASPGSRDPLLPALKRSLACALAAFPPVAGRLQPRSPAESGFDVLCDNQGAVFVDAHSPATTLQHLLTAGLGDVPGSSMYQPSPLWTSLVPDHEESTRGSKPLLFVQLTRLSCGGAVLALQLHHLVADGAAQAHFVASWAELTRGEQIATLPHLDRARLNARSPPRPSSEHPEYTVHQQPPSFSSSKMALPPMTSRIFEFLPEDLAALKTRAASTTQTQNPRDAPSFTGFQALAAHIWKHTSKARNIPPSQPTKLGFAVNGRSRFAPPLPASYFGNANFYALVHSAAASDLISEPLHSTAAGVRSAAQRITDEYMHSALDLVGAQRSPSLVTPSFVGAADLAITSWAAFDAYKVDFGWGVPAFFAPPVYAFVQLAVLLPHPRGDGGVNALVGLFEEQMAALLSDREFYPVR